MNSNNSSPISQSLGFLLIKDPNLNIILNDPDVIQPIKDLIAKLSTDKLFIAKLSNKIQPDDFELLGNITYKKDKKNLISKFTVMIQIFKVRGMIKDELKRFKSYLNYIKKTL